MQNLKLSNEDADKLQRLYLAYRHFLYRNGAYPILKEHALCEDAVHETFVKLARNLDKIDETEERKTKAFLLVVCKRISINIYNKRVKLNKNADLTDEIEVMQTPQSDILSSYVNKETRDRIVKRVKALDPENQAIFFLRYGREWSYDKIADCLEIEAPAARKRIERIRAKLIGYFRKEDDV